MVSIHVLKFGGTSLQNAQYINQAADIIAERIDSAQPVVVASAIGGMTDQLVALSETPEKASEIIPALRTRHRDVYQELIGASANDSQSPLESLFDALEAHANDASTRTQNAAAWRDKLLSFGERASVRLLEAVLQSRGIAAKAWDANHLIKTNRNYGAASVQADATRETIRKSINFKDGIPIITGFIGSADDDTITTLGRSGSDYSASLVADALEAERLEIWTDVDGVLTADPDVVPGAQSINELNFDDIAELASHGIGVVHEKTIEPIRHRNIALHVRNTYNPSHTGTRIEQSIPSNGNFKNVTLAGPYVYLEIHARHFQGLEQLLRKQSPALSPVFSQNGVAEPGCILLEKDAFNAAQDAIYAWAAQDGRELTVRHDVYQLKKFTNKLRNDDVVIGRLFSIMHNRNIRPLAVRRNYNQRYLSLLLPKDSAHTVAEVINQNWIGGKPTVAIFVAGVGAVGGTLIDQIETLDHPDVHINVIGRCNSKRVQWMQGEQSKQPKNWDHIIKKLRDAAASAAIFVDATGSEEVAQLYPALFEAGINIVTPSKLANTSDQTFYNRLHQTADDYDISFRYETTVGAGLPIISTLIDLQQSGDRITEIAGVVSGTMTYLFDKLENGTPFSEAIVEAREKGYAEPDPRDDLSGEDVARKFLTLAREIGWNVEREELQVQSLIPDELELVDADTFLERLPEFDDYWINKLEEAQQKGATLRYVGRLREGKITISAEEVSQKSPIGQLHGTDNLVRIHSKRYADSPIIIQGPGAGKEVTAAGILSDIVKIAADKIKA